MKPTDIVIAPEPGQLFAGIPPGVALDQADGFGIIGLSLEIIEQFFITYGIQGIQMTQRPQPPGFIFQSFQLLPRLDALANVELPLVYSGVPVHERVALAEKMLVRVGLKDKLHHFPNQLSGGQQQRVAIARALCNNPAILLADEPTGALDQQTGKQVMSLFHDLNEEGHTIIMITHDIGIARHAKRIVRLLDGELTEGVAEDA